MGRSTTTFVDFTTATASTPGSSPRSVAASVLISETIRCGPHRIVSLISTEAATELGLEPGVLAVAVVKSTNVVVERPNTPARVVQA